MLREANVSLSRLQVARELVAKLIRDKDLGDFRVAKAEFGSKLGGNSLDVRTCVIVVGLIICLARVRGEGIPYSSVG